MNMKIRAGRNTATKMKRERKRPQHKWTHDQTVSILEAVIDKTKGDPQRFEKPTASAFYNAIFQEYCLDEFEMLGVNVVKNKLRNLKETYMKTDQWRKQLGARLMKEQKIEVFKEHMQKMCPHFKRLQRIYGEIRKDNHNFNTDNIPFFVELSCPADSSDIEHADYDTATEEKLIIPITEASEEADNISSLNSIPVEYKYSVKRPATATTTTTYENLQQPSSKSFIQSLVIAQEKRNEIEEKKLDRQLMFEEERSQVQREMLEIKKQKFDFYREMEEKRFELDKQKIEAELDLKKIEIDKAHELKKYELELKYKYENHLIG